jgi:hypothetical protein
VRLRELLADHLRPPAESRLQRLGLLRRGAAGLRLDGARSLEPEQRQVRARGHDEPDVAEPLPNPGQPAEVVGADVRESYAAVFQS